MIRATELSGRAVVDVDAAERLGRIERIILDPDARRVAGFLISTGHARGDQGYQVVPASAVHAIGPDAVTVHHVVDDAADTARLDALPRAGDVIGRKVVSEQGRLLGVVDDVLIDDANGRIIGYELASDSVMAKIEGILGGKSRHGAYIRADAPLRTGRDLIVAPEAALAQEWPGEVADTGMPAAVDGDTRSPDPRSWIRNERSGHVTSTIP